VLPLLSTSSVRTHVYAYETEVVQITLREAS